MEFIKKIIRHELVSGSFYIFIGSMGANILAFLLNLFLARNLSYADYGIFASLLSVITLSAIPSNSINTIIVKFATAYYSKNEINKVNNFYLISFKFILLFSLVILSLFVLFSIPLSNYLHLENKFYIVITGLTVVAFYFSTLNTAFLQSIMKFAFISTIGFLGGVIKLIVGVVLVYAGFRVFAGLWSIFFMALGIFLIAFVPLSKILKAVSKEKIVIPKKEIINYSIPAFITVLFLTSFTSIDVILVKHFFNSSQAGFYAGLSLVGKVIFYFTAPIPLVMFPLLIKRHTIGQAYKKLFYLAMLLVLIPSSFITFFYFIYPQIVINLFLGGRDYLILSKYLGYFGIFVTLFSVVNVIVSLFLSLNEKRVLFFVVPAAFLQIILIYSFHKDFYQIIYVSIFVCLSLIASLLAYYYKKFKL
ncbi:MAG: oligosaccharide flippase family protein [Candidatus Levybacteria bacterium]|nr:oligosaccharide flippase family protein [Candidatus Levybacteria bacterium]